MFEVGNICYARRLISHKPSNRLYKVDSGILVEMTLSYDPSEFNSGRYFHAYLSAERNQTITFDALPYQPSPYPDEPIDFQMFEKDIAMAELWGIGNSAKTGELYVTYRNGITLSRFVVQKVNAAKLSLERRIDMKKADGYTMLSNSILKWDGTTFTNHKEYYVF